VIDALRGRVWRGYADLRRRVSRSGSATAARVAYGDVRRADVERWVALTAERHAAYRAAVPPVDARVAIVCVSNRPHLLDQVVRCVNAQQHGDHEFVLVTNSDRYDDVDIDAVLAPLTRSSTKVTVLRRPPEQTLGACLNDAAAVTDARFVAKFDDDDHYGPRYLVDALRAHAYAGAGVVGKHTYYAHLSGADRTVLRFPAHEFSYSSTLAGGTLVIDRERTGDLRFADLSLGEDRAFLAACHRRGISTFSADRFSFVQTRSTDNTWTIDSDDFLRNTLPVAPGIPFDIIDR
jgi:glycosyltransferase involved in cell wall biosynthesis